MSLLNETYSDIDMEFIFYAGGSATGYSWEQMKADDISDIFITSLVLDKKQAKERVYVPPFLLFRHQ